MTEKREINMTFTLPKNQSSIIKVIGVGGGGSNAVNHMFRQGIRGVEFIVCNTDEQALETSPVPTKVQLGSTLTEGRGAGANPEVGRNAAIENIEEIKSLLAKDTKMVFVTAGMGGGTGTGAAPIIADAAREMGILTVGIVTVPFRFEGPHRKRFADSGLEELRKSVDTILVISNDKLRESSGARSVIEAFAEADNVLTIAAKGIAEIITVTGYINVDFADVQTVMKNGGAAIMGSAAAEGDGRARRAVELALASPLLNDNRITGAKHVLINITGGTREVMFDEMDQITEYVQAEAGHEANVIFGMGTDENLGEKINVTIIATGFEGGKEEKRIVMALETAVEKQNEAPKPVEPNSNKQVLTYLLDSTPNNEQSPKSTEEKKDIIQDPKSLLDFTVTIKDPNEVPIQQTSTNEENLRRQNERVTHLKNIREKIRPIPVSDMETVPAFRRKGLKLDDVPPSNENVISRWEMWKDPQTNALAFRKGENGYLHDQND
jgi:cell division protein FtsZ